MVRRIDCFSWFISPPSEVVSVAFLFLPGTRVLLGGREPGQVCPLSARASCQHPLPLTLPYPTLPPLETLCVFSEAFKPQGEKHDIGALCGTTEGLRGQGVAETRQGVFRDQRRPSGVCVGAGSRDTSAVRRKISSGMCRIPPAMTPRATPGNT